MYLHLGSDAMAPIAEIIGVFDLSVAAAGSLRANPLASLPAGAADKYASCVLTDTGWIFSEITATTLKKRAESFFARENGNL